ncbi:MAG: TolC family outer membrane protein [Magnetococcales bacterium]|nr:TolC family outer membrane protein [Magnetococcales bacterium]
MVISLALWAPGGLGAATQDVFVGVAERALEANPRIQTAQANLAAALERIPQSRSALLPTVELDLSRGLSQSRWTTDDNTHLKPGEASLSLGQALYNKAALEALEQVEPHVAAYRATLEAERQAVLLEVARVTLAFLEAVEVQRLAASNREVTQRHLEATQDRFRVGEITQTDVSQALARLESARAELLKAENAVAVSRARFAETVGEPPPEDLQLPALNAPLLEREQSVQEEAAIGERPDLQAARHRLAVAELDIALQQGGHYPTLSLSSTASRGWDQGTTLASKQVDRFTLGLALSVPLYAGGRIVSLANQARAERDAQAAQVDRLRLQARREVAQALLDYRNFQAVEGALQAAETAAREAMAGVEQEYRVGSRTALDLLDSQNALFTAQTELARNRFDLVEAQFELFQALGHLRLEELTFGTNAAP